MPAKMLPPAMPAVTLEASPASSRLTAKTTPAAGPSNGSSRERACSSSVTGRPWLKKAAAASKIMELLMQKPTSMEKSVSRYSYLS